MGIVWEAYQKGGPNFGGSLESRLIWWLQLCCSISMLQTQATIGIDFLSKTMYLEALQHGDPLCHTVSRYQSQWVLCVSPMLASLDWLQFCFVFVCLLELVLAVGGWDGSGGSVRSACMHHVPTCHKYGRTELCGFNSGTPPVRRITNDQECKVLNTSTVRVRNIRAWHPCETVSATKWRNAFAVLSRATFAILQVQSWRDPQPDALTPITGICRGQEGQRGKRFAFVNGDKIYTYPN